MAVRVFLGGVDGPVLRLIQGRKVGANMGGKLNGKLARPTVRQRIFHVMDMIELAM